MREYAIEHGSVDLKHLEPPFMEDEAYEKSHECLVVLCHDVFIQYAGGILLVQRRLHPAQDYYWPIGGRVQRGMSTEDSLRQKVKAECNLDLDGIVEIGQARTFFRTDPFGHGRGTDSFNLVYFGEGNGELRLDDLHEEPRIITVAEYFKGATNEFHPYVRDFMEIVMKKHLVR